MSRREKSALDVARAFVKAHRGKGCFAPFTGQDGPAFAAFAHLVDLYAHSDTQGRAAAIAAMRAVLGAPQPKCLPLFKLAIPALMDWSDEEIIWRQVAPAPATSGAPALQQPPLRLVTHTVRHIEPGLPALLDGCICVGGMPPVADCPVHDPMPNDYAQVDPGEDAADDEERSRG